MADSDRKKLVAVLDAIRATPGERSEDRGAESFGEVPGYAAHYHTIYPPLDREYREPEAKRLGLTIPPAYDEFLDLCNGLDCFAQSLSFSGIRPDTDEIAHPASLYIPNVAERPEDATDDMFFFGFYDWDGSLLYADGDGRVHRAERDSVESLASWPSIADAIHDEFMRLAELFKDGFDEDKPTIPDG